ncbi:leucine Rich repeat-containing domain protein, partial [Cooperia oncophora]
MLWSNVAPHFQGVTFGERIVSGKSQHLGLPYHDYPIGYVRSSNRIGSLVTGVFDVTPELRELSINDNDITTIEDGTFAKLTSLKKLSLSGNQISVITKTIKSLVLTGRRLPISNSSGTLDLGTNHFSNVELRGLENLQRLFLNNNSINSLKRVSLRDLPSLILLSLDRNSISEIADGDLSGLARSTRLESLTIAANNISRISQRAFSPVQHLNVLAMQNNQLTTLTKGGQSYLQPLRRLTTPARIGLMSKPFDGNDMHKTLISTTKNVKRFPEPPYFRLHFIRHFGSDRTSP